MKRLKQILTPTKVLIAYCVVASTTALILFFTFLHTYQFQQRMIAERDFQQLLRNNVLAMTRSLTVSPLKHQAYMPEAGLSLPQTDLTPELLYSYSSQKLDNGKTAIYLDFYSRPAVYDSSQRRFDQLLCDGVARISIDDKLHDGNLSPEASLKLDDGRLAYVYPERSDVCSKAGNIRGGVSPDEVLDLLKHVQSY